MSSSKISIKAESRIPQSLFALAWPIYIDLLLHLSTLFINTYMVIHVSKAYLAAMGVGNQVFNLSVTILSFISVGCSVIVAQFLGAGNRNLARKAIHLSITFNILLGGCAAFCIAFFSKSILIRLNTPAHLLDFAHDYLFLLGLCLLPEAISLIFSACLRVYGYARTAMYVTLIANTVSVLGNFIALYGFAGIEPSGLWGVGLSTLAGRFVAVCLLLCLFLFALKFQFAFTHFFHWQKATLRKILHIGLPAAGENILWSSHYMIILGFVGLMGEAELAAQTLYFQFSLFIMSLGIAVSLANEIMVGYYVGAKKYDDAYHCAFRSLRLGVVFTIILVTLFWFVRVPLLENFADDAETLYLLLPLFSISFFLEPGRTFNIVMVNALRAAGDARFPMYMGMIFMWGVAVPVAYVLGISYEWGLVGIWTGFFCDEWMRGLVNAWRWKSRKWQPAVTEKT